MTPMFQTTETVAECVRWDFHWQGGQTPEGTTESSEEVWILAHGLRGTSEPWWRRHGGTDYTTQAGGTERRWNLRHDNKFSRDCLWGVRQKMLLGISEPGV